MTATLFKEPEIQASTPVAGVLDVQQDHAYLRTTGYLPGPADVYVPPAVVRRHGLRRGDLVAGASGTATGKQKFPPLVRVDAVNGEDPAKALRRPDFSTLVPVHPTERLRLEHDPHELTTRVVDLVMPIGKGQRALVVAPPKAGKTSVLQAIARGISRNNPECHLIVVLVGERPEEVTDIQRGVPGEVVASTFDRSPAEHTASAELAIERAKRLVEEGKDVVVLLDSLTRLGRAYNLAAPSNDRILSGGVGVSALLPPKRLLGAARNIEDGGSLTMIATALVETGSTGDNLIFEEYKGTGNAELKLDRKTAGRRVFPAVDVEQSSTRKEELLLAPDELAVTRALRRALESRDVDVLLDGLRKTRTNAEFLAGLTRG
ncbi:transcription termination factor Rho [Saccharothrix variisporea]|uniref:Transcription termination factor Rho n=1 Tax=Saccharothrix variisporea TaxID=543527 RepID=A0A495X8X9_9PSEU|nr:transcription termination factor Rho [Saccharothrix variisporea]